MRAIVGRGTITLGLLLCLMPAARAADKKLPALDRATAERISFRNDVWPILKRHCWGCHSGPKPKGGLSMDSVADMRKGGQSGPLFKAGKPDESILIEAITGPEPAMPQKQPPLPMDKVQVLRHWILAGAQADALTDNPQLDVRAPQIYQFAPAVTSVALSADGKLLAAACRSEVALIDVDGTQPPRRLPTTSDWIAHVEFSPDGKLLAVSGGTPGRYGDVAFYNPGNGQVISTRRVARDTLFRGNFAPDGNAIAVGGADGAVHIVPVDDKQPPRRFELHSDWVLDVVYTPDGTMLVSGGRDKTTKVASAQTGAMLRAVDASPELISAVAATSGFAFSAGRARTLTAYEFKIALSGIEVSGSGNGAVPINKRAQYAKDFEAQPGEVLALAMSGDHKLLAAAGNFAEVRVYSIASRQRVALVTKLPVPIYSVALNGNGSRLAVGSKTGVLQVFELPSGKLIKSQIPVPVVVAVPSANTTGQTASQPVK
jgi:hypothetical protein